MVEDKLSKNWRTSGKGETYSYYSDMKDETLLAAAKKLVETKSKTPIQYDGYYFTSAEFPDSKDKSKKVEMIYRFMEEKVASEKLNSGGGGNWKPTKTFLTTYSDLSFLSWEHDKDSIMALQKQGYVAASAGLVGDMAVHVSSKGDILQAFVLPYKVEVREQVQQGKEET